MPALKTTQPRSRTTRRLFKVASLGFAGLLAGLLSGCSSNGSSHRFFPRIDHTWQPLTTMAVATPLPHTRMTPHLDFSSVQPTANVPYRIRVQTFRIHAARHP